VTVAGDRVRVTARHEGESFDVEAGHVINCAGASLDYRKAVSPLFHGMLEAGEITPGFAGAGLRSTPEGALIDCDGRVSDRLFSIGPARLGVLFESIAIPEIRQQASDLASLLAGRLETGLAAG
jgi:hydroxyacylglutathione hydrolase